MPAEHQQAESETIKHRLSALGFAATDEEITAITREYQAYQDKVRALRALVDTESFPASVFRAPD